MLLIHGGITPEGIVLSRFPGPTRVKVNTNANSNKKVQPTTESSVLGDEELLL